MMAKIPTPKEKQQENHQTMTKSSENNKEETMDAKEYKVDLTASQQKVCRGSGCSCDNQRTLNAV